MPWRVQVIYYVQSGNIRGYTGYIVRKVRTRTDTKILVENPLKKETLWGQEDNITADASWWRSESSGMLHTVTG